MILNKRAAWAVLWRSENKLGGKREHLISEAGFVMLFPTRHEARLWIRENFGYLRNRPDLRREPHGWKMPIPARVVVGVQLLP